MSRIVAAAIIALVAFPSVNDGVAARVSTGTESRMEIGSAVAVHDVDGRAWSLLAPGSGQIDLLLFVATDCPISNRYAPEIARIAHEYQSRGVRTFLVYPNVRTVVADVKTHQREYGLTAVTAIIDARHDLVNAVGPKVTPEAAIYTGTGRVYRGRIDDLYAELGHVRPAAQRHDVRLALDAAIAGKTITPADTEAFGCFIDPPSRNARYARRFGGQVR